MVCTLNEYALWQGSSPHCNRILLQMAVTKRNDSIHFLRGMTIMVIVFRHSLGFFDSQSLQTDFFAKIVDEISFNWTVFFVLISGYLFQHLSPGYNTRKYWLSKLKNILAPYLVVSIFCFILLHYQHIRSMPFYSTDGSNVVFWTIRMLLTGAHSEPLWYIPVILTIFCLGPALYRLSRKDLTIIATACLLLSVMTFKPDPQESLKNVLHYLPIYIVGMLLCQKRAFLKDQIDKNLPFLIAFFVAIVAMSFHKKLGLSWLNIADDYLMSLEKIILFVILYSLLNRVQLANWCSRSLSYFADISFAIYFIHMIIITFLLEVLSSFSWWHRVTTLENGFLSTTATGLFTMLVLLLCSGIVTLVRFALGKKSRLMLGS